MHRQPSADLIFCQLVHLSSVAYLFDSSILLFDGLLFVSTIIDTMATPPITHAELTATQMLETLPPAAAETIRRYSLAKGQSIVQTLKDGLLKIADEVNTSAKQDLVGA